MKQRLNSLRFVLWRNLMVYAIISFGILYILQALILSKAYLLIKKQEFITLSDKIVDAYINDDRALINDIGQKNSMVVIVFKEDEVLFVSESSLPYDTEAITIDIAKDYMGQFYATILSANKKIVVLDDDMYSNGALVYGGAISINNESVYVYVNLPVEGSSLARNISSIILLIALFVSFCLALLVALILSRRISSPILSLNKSVKKLSKGDYSVLFNADKGFNEIKELSDSLNHAKDDLKQIDVLQKELIANVSHDLRTPLTLIKSYAEMIKDISGENKELREKHLDVIILETDRLASLVNDMLNLSKITSNALKLQFESINLSELLKHYKVQFMPIITKNNILYEEDIMDDVYINASKNELNQAIYNFITNAFTYTKDYVKVSLSINNDEYIVSVKDNGEGIKEEELERIWDRYYRSKENHVRNKVGSGLGLSIAKEILKKHNFDYGCYNDNGAIFYFKVKK